jgi:hypothetical protein
MEGDMRLLSLILNPAIISTVALFLAVLWMLKDQKDKTRPLLVFALTLNLFFGLLLTVFMSREGSLLPWKYDHILFALDASLGLPAATIARPLQGFLRVPLIVIYQLMVPMMICWFLVTRYRNVRGFVVLAYVGELVAGPLMYAVLPGCGPLYAFGAQWLNPPHVETTAIKLAAMPNAFPSLHIGTAFLLVLFAPGKLWRAVAIAFLICTGLATLSTGEHYVIDLFAGLIFGCFAASVGYRRYRSASLYLAAVLAWSISVRFGYASLIAHPWLLRSMVALTLAIAVRAVVKEWRIPAVSVASAEDPAIGVLQE